MQQKIVYECGCTTGGDNVAASCPVHGYSILQPCKHIDSCDMSEIIGGFPMCYNPFDSMRNVCKDYEA
jgi:hypothetical protein